LLLTGDELTVPFITHFLRHQSGDTSCSKQPATHSTTSTRRQASAFENKV
jgi:hypothetical protein